MVESLLFMGAGGGAGRKPHRLRKLIVLTQKISVGTGDVVIVNLLHHVVEPFLTAPSRGIPLFDDSLSWYPPL